ncbi:MAG: hypothetical protein ACRD96_20310 [Bryobacteraceae bacterium]
MFTWICPQCGREVPPSYSECPDCVAKAKAPAPAPLAVPVTTEPPAPTVAAAPIPKARRRRAGIPTWVMSILFTAGFGVLVGGVYFVAVPYIKKDAATAKSTPAQIALENPPPAGSKPHPMQRHIEIVGLRLFQDKDKKPHVRFVVVNHSAAELTELGGDVTLMALAAGGQVAPVGTFGFQALAVGAYASSDQTAPLRTTLQVYELPDWQNLRADLRLTAP